MTATSARSDRPGSSCCIPWQRYQSGIPGEHGPMTSNLLQALRVLAIGFLTAFAGGAPAATEAPDVLVKRTVEEVLQAIQQTPERAALHRIAEQKVLPNFDFREMTRLAVGTNWRKASPEQQAALEGGFRKLLVNVYTTALTKSGQKGGGRTLEVKPAAAKGDETVVKTVIKEPDGQRVAIDYRMASRDGGWKVYDVVVEGVSLVTSYRSSFESEVSKGGVDGLIKAL
ncbi:MAG: ABC transporter substrate-binding protein, partial [Betaproteobacteria bacterium]